MAGGRSKIPEARASSWEAIYADGPTRRPAGHRRLCDRDRRLLAPGGDLTVSVDCFEIENLIDILLRQDTVNSVFFNEGTRETEGVDLSQLWNWEMSDWFASIPGRAGFRLNHTCLMDFTEEKFGTEQEFVGDTGFAREAGEKARPESGPGRRGRPLRFL